MLAENKHKIAYYYSAGAFVLLLFLKFVSSDFFRDFVDLSLSFLPLIIILAVAISAFLQYRKNSGDEMRRMAIRHYALVEMLILLFITLLFYVLNSPGSFSPVIEALGKISRQISLENYFFTILCLSLATVGFGVIFIFFRLYQKSQGVYSGSINELVKKDLYAMFFVIVFLFFSSILTYPKAYAPITDTTGQIFSNIFFPRNDDRTLMERLTNTRIDSLKSAFSKTYGSISKNVGDTSIKLTTSIVDTKDSLSGTITRTNKDLKETLSKDIEDRLDVSGGSLDGDLTIEDDLTVEGTTYLADAIPDSDDTYDLGSVSKGWNNVYIHRLYGSSILTIGDLNTSHGLSGTSDLLVSGDLEVKGDIYFDGALDMGANKITNLADPVDAQDAVTLAYYQSNTPTGVFSRTAPNGPIYASNSGDDLDMLANPILNIGNNGTDFDSSGALTLAGGLTLSNLVTGLLEVNSGAVGLATAGTDYENPLTFSNSLSRSTNTVTLVNDAASPGNSQYYGTNGSGTKGWFAISAGVTDHSLLSNLTYATAGHTGFEPTIAAGTTGQYYRGDKSWQTLNTSAVSGLGTIATQNSNAVSITGGSASGITQLTVDNIDLNGNTISTSTGDLIIDPDGSGDVDLSGSQLINIGNSGTDFGSDGGLTLAANLAVTGGSITSSSGAISFGDENLSTTGTVTFPTLIGGTGTTSDLILKTTTGVAASGADMLFQTGSNGLTEAMKIDYQGITYVNSLQSGAQSFPDDAGVTQWVDLNMTTAITTAGTVESYSAMLDGTAALTVYGEANGSGGIQNGPRIGIGTTAPSSNLHIKGNGNDQLTIQSAGISTEKGSIAFQKSNGTINSETAISSGDMLGQVSIIGATGNNTYDTARRVFEIDASENWTSLTGGYDMTFWTRPNAQGSLGAPSERMRITSGGNVGINDTTPDGLLDIEPTGAVTAASYGINLSNLTTNATTDGINKYGAYITSTGAWTGSGGTATNNYGLYINTTAGADNNYDIYAASGANLTTAGTWTNAPSYRRYKDKAGETSGYLDKLMALDIDEWQYKNDKIDGMNRFKADPNRHASPYLDDFYDVFGLGTDKGVNTQDLAGVALASVKELNTRFINENNLTDADIAGITLKTDENATTVSGLQNSIDENLILIESRIKNQEASVDDLDSQLTDYELRITNLETLSQALQAQIADLQAKANTELNVAQINANTTDVAFLKTLLGVERVKNPEDVDILGKVSSEITETGALAIKIADKDAPTIGSGEILAITKDEDKDGIDDDTDSDAKSVVIDTKAVTENSKIFVTPKSATADPLAVTKIKDGESFTVEVANPVAEDLKFDWIIIDEIKM